MVIVAHNTMSYRPPKQWWLRPIKFIAKCQKCDYKTLHEKYNVNSFDLRIFYDKQHNIEFRHGIFRYKGDDIYDILDYCNKQNMYVRFLFEYRWSTEKRDDLEELKHKFRQLCFEVQNGYQHITFYGGYITETNEILYDFGTNIQEIGFYSSVTSFFENCNSTFLKKIDDWWPWLYARLHNRKNMKENKIKYDNENIHISYDFVDIQ